MSSYLLRRLPAAMLTLLGASVIVFVLMQIAPGSPATVVAGSDATPEQLASIKRELGLDVPAPLQYLDWLRGLVSGDLGTSLVNRQPIAELIGSRLESTVELALSAALLMCLLGISLGAIGGSTRSNRVRAMLDGSSSVLLALPTYVTSVILLFIFGVVWTAMPISGEALMSENSTAALQYLVLPSIALAIPHSAVIGRLLATSMREAMHEDYVRAARAKGCSYRRIVWIHVLRNAMSTAIVVIGIRFGGLLGGAVLVESLFARNGLGPLLVSSVLSRDYFVVQDLILFAVAAAIVAQVLSEVALALADARVRLA